MTMLEIILSTILFIVLFIFVTSFFDIYEYVYYKHLKDRKRLLYYDIETNSYIYTDNKKIQKVKRQSRNK